MGKKRVIIYGLGSDFDFYKEDLLKAFTVVGITDSRTRPTDPEWSKLYIEPKDLGRSEYDQIIITSLKWVEDIRAYIHQLVSISDDNIVDIGGLTDSLDAFHSTELKEALKNHQLDERVFVIGDSHARFFGEASREKGMCFRCFDREKDIRFFEPDLIPFVSFHVGPGLAYNLNRYGTTVKAREKIDYLLENWIPKHGRLLFVFGEIDIRVHVIKQAESQNLPVQDVLIQIADHYMDFLSSLKNDHKIYIWGPVASQSDQGKVDPHYPRYGKMENRNRATELFNGIMRSKCKENGISYLSVFHELIDDNYRTKSEYYMDSVHLGKKAWSVAGDEFSKVDIAVDI